MSEATITLIGVLATNIVVVGCRIWSSFEHKDTSVKVDAISKNTNGFSQALKEAYAEGMEAQRKIDELRAAK